MKKVGFLIILVLVTGCSSVSQSNYNELVLERNEILQENELLRKEKQDYLETSSEMMTVNLNGEFTAFVRELLADETVDDSVPAYAILELFQVSPILVSLGEVGSQVSEGESYVFTIEPKDIEITLEEYESGYPEVGRSFLNYNVRIESIRPWAKEDFAGLEYNQLKYSPLENN